jgi:hypothetical protein
MTPGARLSLLRGIVCALALAACSRAGTNDGGISTDSLSYLPGTVIPVGLLDPRAWMDSSHVRRYSAMLTTFHEAELTSSDRDESREAYRFIWIRSFHKPFVVRIERRGASAIVVVNAGYDDSDTAKTVRRDSFPLSSAEWDDLVATLDRERFWQQPRAGDTIRSYVDGAQWIVEGTRQQRYTIVDRVSPSDTGADSFLRRIGLVFLSKGKVSVPATTLY